MDYIKNLMNNNKFLKIVSIVLVVAIVLTSVVGIAANVIAGKKIDCEKVVAEYNGEAKDFSSYFTSMPEDEMAKRLDTIEAELLTIINMVDIDALIYTDEVATAITKFTCQLIGKELDKTKFKALKKDYRVAYDFIVAQKEAGKTWDDLGVIPFGIEDGDKDAFIKACAAGSEAFGKNLLKVMLNAPSAYNEVLVPVLESLHTGAMPTMGKFVSKTGLSGSERMEIMIAQVLTIVEPLKAAPLTYLCEIAPDFIKNYAAAVELLNSKKGVEKRAKLVMPTVEEFLNQLLSAFNFSVPTLDVEAVSKMGTASVDKSGANRGERVRIDGDREVVFAFFADYILDTLVNADNFNLVVDLLTKKIKTDEVQTSLAGEILNSDIFTVFLADFVDLISKIQGRTAPDVEAEVNAYNSEPKDFSELFAWPATEDTVSASIDALDALIIGSLSDFNIDGMLYTDAFATTIARITGMLCSKEISDLSFNALRKNFPEAYKYMMDAQAAGKTWKDIDTIPFGVAAGDKDMFIKACAAGSEHFGDALALCLLAAPTAYEEALLPVLESFHTGPMPTIKDFILTTKLDGAKRMELLIEKVLTIYEPMMAAPVTFLCEFLPNLVASYTKASDFAAANPNVLAKAGMNLMPIGQLLSTIAGDFGITLPEYDFAALTKYGTARVASSGDIGGERMEIVGDREAVFVAISGYISDVISTEGNMSAMGSMLTNEMGMESEAVTTLLSALETVVVTIDGLDISGKLSGVTSAIGGLVAA